MHLGRDGIAGLVLLGLSLVLLAASINLPQLPLVPIGPGFYPRIVLSILAGASIVLIVQDVVRARAAGPTGTAVGMAVPVRVAAAFAIVGAYALLMPWLGFRIATVLFVGGLQAVLELPRSAKQAVVLALIALATSAVTYVVFERYLLVLLPRGVWTGY
jgi:hypothetical protein